MSNSNSRSTYAHMEHGILRNPREGRVYGHETQRLDEKKMADTYSGRISEQCAHETSSRQYLKNVTDLINRKHSIWEKDKHKNYATDIQLNLHSDIGDRFIWPSVYRRKTAKEAKFRLFISSRPSISVEHIWYVLVLNPVGRLTKPGYKDITLLAFYTLLF